MGKRRPAPGKGKRIVAESANLNPWVPAFSDELAAWTRLAPFLAFVFLVVLYIATLTPSVAGGDSGELAAAGLTGGVPHPSGYPLFALLARLFGALPLGHSAIWRVNLLSAVSMAAAGGLLCAVVQSWTRNAAAGLMAAALFGTSPVVWSNATSAEVFGLNAAFVALALYLWSRVEHTLSRRDVFALLLASGLAMCNHHAFVFVGAPLVLRSLWVARSSLGVRGVALAFVFGLLGLVPHLYLISASASGAAVSWDYGGTWDGLVGHILRRTYGTFSMGRPTSEAVFVTEGTFFPTLWHLWGYAFPRLLWLGPLLAIAGLYLGAKSRPTRGAALVVLSVICLYSLTFSGLSNLSTARPLYLSVLGRFCIESDLLLAIASGFGLAALLHRLGTRWPGRRRWQRWALLAAAATFVLGVVVHGGEASGRNNTVLRDFVTTAFASLPANAIVITEGDEVTNSAFYLHDVEKLRPDVVHLGRTYLAAPWYTAYQRRLHRDVYLPEGGYGQHGWNIKQLLDGNPKRPVIVIGHLDDWDQSWESGYRLSPYGLVYALIRASEVPGYQEWAERDGKAMSGYDVVPALRAPEESWENAVAQRILGMQVGRAHLCLVYSSEMGNAPEPARNAVRLLEDVVAKTGGDEALGIAGWPGLRRLDTGPALWKDLGIAYDVLARVDGQDAARVVLAYQRFVERAAADDPDLPRVRRILEEASTPDLGAIIRRRMAPSPADSAK
ncbi:MAG TPA: DUF2723 domain-containing protein [Polyangia bacterium]|nr:DUF2723 domain-containing protein [Polyangia bacterium]